MKCKAHFPITLPTLIINLFPVCQSDVEEKLAPSFISSSINWRRKWQPTPVLLPGKFHGWRSLVGYSPWGHKDSDTTEWLHFLSLINYPFIFFAHFSIQLVFIFPLICNSLHNLGIYFSVNFLQSFVFLLQSILGHINIKILMSSKSSLISIPSLYSISRLRSSSIPPRF